MARSARGHRSRRTSCPRPRCARRCGIPGTSVRTAFLCRDKPAMKEALREAGMPTAASTGAATPEEARASPRAHRLPADRQAAQRGGRRGHLARRRRRRRSSGRSTRAASTAARRSRSRSSSRGTRASSTPSRSAAASSTSSSATTTRTSSRRCARAGSRPSSSPPTASTREGYAELEALGRAGHRGARHRHLGDPHGVVLRPQGAALLRDRLPPARRRRLGSLQRRQRDRPLPRVGGGDRARPPEQRALAALRGGYHCAAARPRRPDRRLRGRRAGRSGRSAPWILDAHLPPPGTPTQPVEAGYMANAWMRLRHPDYDQLRQMLDFVGQTVKVRAA